MWSLYGRYVGGSVWCAPQSDGTAHTLTQMCPSVVQVPALPTPVPASTIDRPLTRDVDLVVDPIPQRRSTRISLRDHAIFLIRAKTSPTLQLILASTRWTVPTNSSSTTWHTMQVPSSLALAQIGIRVNMTDIYSLLLMLKFLQYSTCSKQY